MDRITITERGLIDDWLADKVATKEPQLKPVSVSKAWKGRKPVKWSGPKHKRSQGDQRRFIEPYAPLNGKDNALSYDHPAMTEMRTVFPRSVTTTDGRPLKSGVNSCKIGGRVLVGRLKVAPIYTLTLEERRTCPASCTLLAECYGNLMHMAKRYEHGPDLEHDIEAQLDEICTKNYGPVLVRLHVLGDFYSVEYVRFWHLMLNLFPNLHIFGFTARPESGSIGKAIAGLREAYPTRFMVRLSGSKERWGSYVVKHNPGKQLGSAIVCPEQLDSLDGHKFHRHCGNCAACWSTDKPIVFMRH